MLDFGFVFKLEHLIDLTISRKSIIDATSIRKLFESLKFLSSFEFNYSNKRTSIQVDLSNQFEVGIGKKKCQILPDLAAAIQLLVG